MKQGVTSVEKATGVTGSSFALPMVAAVQGMQARNVRRITRMKSVGFTGLKVAGNWKLENNK